ncbi:peptide ABC transporter substrate-binding protein [Epibacterium ulvae]|uniref:ABC transporter substrate-binding protein n=1 Tax=Epibacterium ulvae TaxID=1156985 RepID=UPI001BFBFEF3|nr:ABC transporter substrate-binding protein [Epibacterium ulvae]MBT8153558.1 peptide ABC transporter substrate-binding protein [Epibacterium ulvae]
MNRMDRRALFTSGAAAALLAATGTSVHGAPQRGGLLRLAIPRDPELMRNLALRASHDTLVEIGPDGVLRGELASGWRSDARALRWEFDLRRDARFQSGAPVAVSDVIDSLTQVIEDIWSIQAAGPNRVIIELSSPNPHLPYVLSASGCVISQRGATVDTLDQGAGSGCYAITRANEGRDFRAERIAHHYKDHLAGWLDTVEVAVIPDPAIRAEALRDGYVDVAAFPAQQILRDRRDLTFHPSVEDMQIVAHHGVGVPRQVGKVSALDDARLLERWWKI